MIFRQVHWKRQHNLGNGLVLHMKGDIVFITYGQQYGYITVYVLIMLKLTWDIHMHM